MARRLLSDAGVDAKQHLVNPGDELLTEVTGAKEPSWEPWIEPPEPVRERRGRGGPRRGGYRGGYRGERGGGYRGGYRGDRSRGERGEGGYRRGQILAQAVCDLICGAAGGGQGGAEILVLVDLVSLLHSQHDDTISETGDGLPLPLDTIRDLCRQPDATITTALTNQTGIVTAIGHHSTPNRDDSGGDQPPGRPAEGRFGDIARAVAAAIANASGEELTMGRTIRVANRAQRRARSC